MVRKILSIVTLIVVAFALLPAVAALAADGTADVDAQHRDVFAKNAANLTVTVRNTGNATPGPINLNGTQAGEPITRVIMDLPFYINNAACSGFTASDGDAWTCQAVNSNQGGQSRLIYSTTANGIAGQASTVFPSIANIVAPETIERTATLEVFGSGPANPNQFKRFTGNLNIVIHGLELIQGITLDENRTGATSVTRYTAGQVIDANFKLSNRAGVDTNITPRLTSPSFTGTKSAGRDLLPAGVANENYAFNVPTATFTGTERTRQTFTAAATGTVGSTTGDAVTINGAQVLRSTELQNVDIEAPSTLTLGDKTTVLVDGQADLSVPSRNDTSISIAGTKFNYPLVNLLNGTQPTQLVLTIAGCTPNGTNTCSITAPLSDVTSPNGQTSYGSNLPRIGTANTGLRFKYNDVDLADLDSGQPADLVNVNASFTFAGKDDNAFNFPPVTFTINNLLTIDLAGPKLHLNEPVANIVANTAADSDIVTYSGFVAHANDLESMTITASSTQNAVNVTLPANQRGQRATGEFFYQEIVATETNLSSPTNCDGTIYAGTPGLVCQSFSVNRTLPGQKNAASGEFTTALGLGGAATLKVDGKSADDAGNPGLSAPNIKDGAPVPNSIAVDNDHPTINPTLILDVNDPADPNDDTREALAYYVQIPGVNNGNPVVRVANDPGINNDTLTGGCDPARWSVSGVNVTQVLFNDGTPCTPTGAPAGPGNLTTDKNDRMLVLSGPINPSANTVTFNYLSNPGLQVNTSLAAGPPLADRLKNNAYDQSGRVLDILTPAIPNLVRVTRADTFNGGDRETAGQRTDGVTGITSYYSNISDLKINLGTTGFERGADFLEVYKVEANGDLTLIGNRISTAQLGQNDSLELTHNEIAFTNAADGVVANYERAFRFVRVVQGQSVIETPGPIRYASFVYDTVDLNAKSVNLTLADGPDTLRVGFGGEAFASNEIAILGGANLDWSGLRTVAAPGGQTGLARDQADQVSNGVNEVVLEINYRGAADKSDFYGSEYYRNFLPMADGETVEDLAGNELAYDFHIKADGSIVPGPNS